MNAINSDPMARVGTPPPQPETTCNFDGLPGAFLDGALRSFIQWTPRWSSERSKWLKAPVRSGWTDPSIHEGLARIRGLLNVVNVNGPVNGLGFVINDLHNYVVLDLDDVCPETVPLLARCPTFMERSPSWGKPGKGKNRYHAVYRLKDVSDKARFKGRYTLDMGEGRAIDLFIHSGYVCCTGNVGAGHGQRVTTITGDDLLAMFPESAVRDDGVQVRQLRDEQPDLFTNPPGTPDLGLWGDAVSCLRTDGTVQQLMTRMHVSYNGYWVAGVAACHAVSRGSAAGYAAAEAFSESSGDDYDEGELAGLWNSLESSGTRGQIGVGTYVHMYRAFTISWPVCSAKGVPGVQAPENVDAFLSWARVNVCIEVDGSSIFLMPVDGDIDGICHPLVGEHSDEDGGATGPIGRFYRDQTHWMADTGANSYSSLANEVYRQMRRLGCMVQHKHVHNCLEERALAISPDQRSSRLYIRLMALTDDQVGTGDVDRYLDYFVLDQSQHSAKTGQGTSFDEDFARTVMRKFLRGMVASIIPASRLRAGHSAATKEIMLILMGRQKTNKSSIFQRMFPPEIRNSVWAMSDPSKEVDSADAFTGASGKLLIEHDECENQFNGNKKARMKSYMTCRSRTCRPAYFRNNVVIEKSWGDCGSTNEPDLNIPVDGLRRYLAIHISTCKTFELDRDVARNAFDQWGFLRQLVDEVVAVSNMEEQVPWLMTDSEARVVSAAAAATTMESDAMSGLRSTAEHLDLGNQLISDFDGVPYTEVRQWLIGSKPRPEGISSRWRALPIGKLKELVRNESPGKLSSHSMKEAMAALWQNAVAEHGQGDNISFAAECPSGVAVGARLYVTRHGTVPLGNRSVYLIKTLDKAAAAGEAFTMT